MEGGCLKQLVYAFMLLLLPLSLSLEFNNSDGITRCIERERQALLAFKQGFTTGHGDSKVLSSWGRKRLLQIARSLLRQTKLAM
ncbi:hypothetical protein M0R45_034358 [Rubus argutus]|uniref:Leucine-rich repeat-containing N-terminal plant-type domain-containing protein n=1 Tax=Rubus argutus TaxID=59490 RepID=A0AAW1VQ34_RUBAR